MVDLEELRRTYGIRVVSDHLSKALSGAKRVEGKGKSSTTTAARLCLLINGLY